MKVTLLTTEIESRHQREHALKLVSQCYQTDKLTFKKLCNIAQKHRTILELFDVAFLLEGISYASHVHICRHRLITPFVESQRYTQTYKTIVPEKIIKDRSNTEMFTLLCEKSFKVYEDLLVKGVAKEDARYVLPQGVAINMGFKTNIREFLHILDLREAPEAMPETREIAKTMRMAVMENEVLRELIK